jgi:hypothetical protein
MAIRLSLLFFLLVSGCVPPAYEYAKARNPDCNVVLMAENSETVIVSIKCPDEKVFQRSYKKK